MSYGSFSPTRRRYLPQQYGPDIPAQMPSALAPLPVLQAPQDNPLGGAMGAIGKALAGKFSSPETAPRPDGSSPYDSLPSANPGKLVPDGSSPYDSLPASSPNFLSKLRDRVPLFARGGVLRKPGDVAIVGDEGPEVAQVDTDGSTNIIPLDDTRARRVLTGQGQSPTGPYVPPDDSTPPPLPRTLSAVRQQVADAPPILAQTVGAQPLVKTPPTADDYGIYGQDVSSPAGESTMRPKWADPYDEVTSKYLATNQALMNPEQLPKAHGLKRALPIIAGFLQGAATNPERPLAAGIGGAAAGAVGTAVDPRLATREGLELQQSQTAPAYQAAIQQRQLAIQNALQRANLLKTAAETDLARAHTGYYASRAADLANPKPQIVQRRDGVYLLNRDGSSVKTDIPAEKATAKTDWIEGVLNRYDDDGVPHPVINPDTKKPITDSTKVPVVEDGLSVTPGQALGYRGQVQGAEADAANKNRDRERDNQTEVNTTNYQNEHTAWQQAGSVIGEYNKSYRALQQNLESAQTNNSQVKETESYLSKNPNDQKAQAAYEKLLAQRAQIEAENKRLKDEVNAYAEPLNTYHRHVTQLPSGYLQVGPEPQKPAPVARQPVQPRRGGARRSAPANDPLGLYQ